jgi:hypothetical protein
MISKIKENNDDVNYQMYIIFTIVITFAVGFYFIYPKGESGLTKLANFVQLPILAALTINSIISIQNYRKLLESKSQDYGTQYNKLIDNRISKIDQLFLNNTNLNRLYSQLYPEVRLVSNVRVTNNVIKCEHHACSIIFQFISDIYAQLQLKLNSEDYIEWLQTFKKWVRSPIMRKHWKYFRNEHHPEFAKFMDDLIVLHQQTPRISGAD